MKPELSTAHLGTTDLFIVPCQKRPKTRPTTIDQGAIEAVSIVEVPNRYLAGNGSGIKELC
jgi:hypothetical protein